MKKYAESTSGPRKAYDLVNTKYDRRTDRWTDKVIHICGTLLRWWPQNASFDKYIIISNEDKNEGTCNSANLKQKLKSICRQC